MPLKDRTFSWSC